jgi:hypothetical protein
MMNRRGGVLFWGAGRKKFCSGIWKPFLNSFFSYLVLPTLKETAISVLPVPSTT